MQTSILTNTSAMIALQTLRKTNSGLAEVQNQISTGKRVATAKDNAAVFAITATMQSDVAGFKAINDSLALGSSTVAVASNAGNQIGDLLDQIKGKIVAANEDNVDRATLQDEIVELRNQITGIVDAAQFNGLNLLKNDETVDILASLDRASSGEVTTSSISVVGRDFSAAAGTAGTDAGGQNASVSGGGVTAGQSVVTFTSGADFADSSIAIGGYNIVASTRQPHGGRPRHHRRRRRSLLRPGDQHARHRRPDGDHPSQHWHARQCRTRDRQQRVDGRRLTP